MDSYRCILLDEKKRQANQLKKKFGSKREYQEHEVVKARNKLKALASEFGMDFVDPNPTVHSRYYSHREFKREIIEELTPVQITQYETEIDLYLAEIKFLDKIKAAEFNRCLHEGSLDPFVIHGNEVPGAVSKLMWKRKESLNEK